VAYHAAVPGSAAKLDTSKSEAAYEAACRLMPGCVSSPVRAFKAVGGTPLFMAKAKGSQLTDVDGNAYIDYVGSWGPLILGHADERVVAAIDKAAAKGCSFGAPTEAETHLAALISSRMPAVEMVRFVNSGTEAVMSAIRLARGTTGREKIIKFEGCYHGHFDALLVKTGSGGLSFGTPSSSGVPRGAVADTLVLPYNDASAVENALRAHGEEVAAVLIEPIAGNMGLVPPNLGYLEDLRRLCTAHETLLIFDEVMTGFRVARGGAQALYQVEPDLTCLGKILGGGTPLAAYGGRRELMERVAPQGDVYQAGTLSGNPLAVAAGIATLDALEDGHSYEVLESLSGRLAVGLEAAASRAAVAARVARVGSMLCLFFSDTQVTDCASAMRCDSRAYATFFHALLERGVYPPPSQFECWFVSLAHTQEQIDATISAAAEAFEATKSVRPE
jgi:glutamate-1-semialdehyde 2,1-aminomutase